MSTVARLGSYCAALAVVAGIGWGLGDVVSADEPARQGTHGMDVTQQPVGGVKWSTETNGEGI